MRHPLTALVVPDGLVILVAAALLYSRPLLAPAAPVLPALPVLVLVVGAVLAVRFGRGRVLLALATLALADRALVWPAGGPAISEAVALVAPVWLALLGLLPERGVLTGATARRLGALTVSALAVALPVLSSDPGALAWLATPLLPQRLTSWSPVGDLALVAMAGGLLVLAGRFVRRPHASVRALFWSVIAVFLALAAPPPGLGAALAPSTFLLAAGGLVLSLAVIEESHAMAFRDGLTGMESRRALDEALRSVAGGFTLAMVDVDHFKRCNDTYGHETGDQVLRMVARSLERVASGARVFRYGGEEFAVLFVGRGLDDCLPALERARETVEHTPFTLRAADRPRKRPRKPARRSRAHAVAVTVSIGVAERREPGVAPDDALRAADEALYRAKHAGRNRVEVSGKRQAHA